MQSLDTKVTNLVHPLRAVCLRWVYKFSDALPPTVFEEIRATKKDYHIPMVYCIFDRNWQLGRRFGLLTKGQDDDAWWSLVSGKD